MKVLPLLSSLLLSLSSAYKYYFYPVPTDMRKSFDGLSGLIQESFQDKLYTASVFIFINKRRDRIKLLCWHQSGFTIYYKRLEKGCFELPDKSIKADKQLDWKTLLLVLEGIELKSIKYRTRFNKIA